MTEGAVVDRILLLLQYLTSAMITTEIPIPIGIRMGFLSFHFFLHFFQFFFSHITKSRIQFGRRVRILLITELLWSLSLFNNREIHYDYISSAMTQIAE